MYSPGVPDFVSEGIYHTLRAAETVFNVKFWRNEIEGGDVTGGWSASTLARTFARHDWETFTLEIEKTLPELLLAALNHPDLPAELYNDIHDGLNSLTSNDKAVANIHHIRWALSNAPDAIDRTLGRRGKGGAR
jgi:hypothetical protein